MTLLTPSFTNWFLALLSMTIAVACTGDIRELSQNRFMKMVEDREVEQITIVNGQVVEVRLTSKALASRPYRDLFGDGRRFGKGEPNFQFKIVSEDAFRDDIKRMNLTFPIVNENRNLFGSTSR